MGICGTGMAGLAGMLREKGYRVTGSDRDVYPPMSELLAELRIPVATGYRPGNLHPAPDLVIVGNVITRENPEALALSRLGLSYLSFPQALRHFAFRTRRSVVIAGTHGKTTTSSLTAWILECAGMDPGFMIGGIPGNFQAGFKLGKGPFFVIEGDEYDTAFFDKGPKFLHYAPWAAILTSIEFDHADIYRDLDHVIGSFEMFVDLIPEEGRLIANWDDPVVRSVAGRAKCPVLGYGFSKNAPWRAATVDRSGGMTRVEVRNPGGTMTLETPLYGRHNISNLLSAIALSDFLSVPKPALRKAARGFKGVRRRQEVIGECRGVLVLDDFAHHPTAVRETVRAVRDRYPDRRLVAVFEPRSNSSRRNIFQSEYAGAFGGADRVMVPEPSMTEKIPAAERFSSSRLARDLRKRGITADAFPDAGALLAALVRETRDGDVVLVMSNGAFDNLPRRLMASLEARRTGT